MSNPIIKPRSSSTSILSRWLEQTTSSPELQVKFRLRGNTLHILYEGSPYPDRYEVLLRLIPALQSTNLNSLIPVGQAQIYQVQLYGCQSGQNRPNWTSCLYLNHLDRHLEQLKQVQQLSTELALSAAQKAGQKQATPTLMERGRIEQERKADQNVRKQTDSARHSLTTAHLVPPSLESDSSALALSNLSLAKRGQEMAIACYLSETLSEFGVAVRVSAKSIPYTPPATVRSTNDTIPATLITKRLWVACEAAYSPDPSLLGEPITQKLRNLEIEGYRDAIILFQVAGEAQPDWMLRVDLTPPGEMLREWARWGDVEAVQRLLNQDLTNLQLRITTATLNETTLHLLCGGLSKQPAADQALIAHQKRAKAEIALLLESLGPQGIHSATVYGQVSGQEAPAWVEWLELPAAIYPDLGDSAMTLAQQGDWSAIAFLLHRLLNPDLKKYLATGGIRLQLLPKQDLLHIMSEASLCPEQRQVAPIITRFMQQLQLPNVAGVRIYGRRAGQKTPLWSYGVDLAPRDRLVPEVAPEFAATDTYVNDLLPQPGEQVTRPDLTPVALQSAWAQVQHRVLHSLQHGLIRSQLFTPIADTQTQSIALPGQVSYRGTKVALIWGAAGMLLMLQANWMLGHVLRSRAAQPIAEAQLAHKSSAPANSPAAPTPAVVKATPKAAPDGTASVKLKRSPNTDSSVFNTRSFTKPAETNSSDPELPSSGAANGSTGDSAGATRAALPYTPSSQQSNQATAEFLAENSSLPTFNSHQLDEKLKLYYHFLQESGPPDVMIVGSSRALRGVDPVALEAALSKLGYTHAKIFNFGINGATAQVVDLILQRILTPDQMPRMVLWADGARAFNSGAVDVTYNGIVGSEAYHQLAAGKLSIPAPASAEGAVGETSAAPTSEGINASLTASYQGLDRWFSQQLGAVSGLYSDRDRLKHLFQEGLTALLPAAVPEELPASDPQQASEPSGGVLPPGQTPIDSNGFLSLSVQFNPATYYQKYARVGGEYDSDYEDFHITGRQEVALQSLLRFTRQRAIPVIFINLPLTEDYLDPVRLKYEQGFKEYMVRLSMNQPSFDFRDLSEKWTTQYNYFSDPSHLNRYGAYAVSKSLAQDPLIPWSKPEQSASSQPQQGKGSDQDLLTLR